MPPVPATLLLFLFSALWTAFRPVVVISDERPPCGGKDQCFFLYPNGYKFVPKLIGRPELGYKKYLGEILGYKNVSDRTYHSLIEQTLLETENTKI